MTTLQQNERTLLMVVFWLIIIHLIVSFIFIIVDFSAASKSKPSSKSLKLSGAGWSVSFIVCLVLAILVLAALGYEKQRKDTPCPIQLSYPNENAQDRKDIRAVIDLVRSKPLRPTPSADRRFTPPPYIGGDLWLPYDAGRVYLVLTGYYRLNLQMPAIQDGPYKSLLQKYSTIPVGYVEGNKLFSLQGTEWWPSPQISSH